MKVIAMEYIIILSLLNVSIIWVFMLEKCFMTFYYKLSFTIKVELLFQDSLDSLIDMK